MNLYLTISIIIVLFAISEWMSLHNRKSNWMIYLYVDIIRFFVIIFSIASIGYIAYDNNKLSATNEYKLELLEHYDSLRILQTEMIDSMGNHLWNKHNCDLPMFDGDLLDNIHKQETKIDSLEQIK